MKSTQGADLIGDETFYFRLVILLPYIYKQGFQIATSIPRNLLLTTREKKAEDILPYVSSYNPNNTEIFGILKSNIHILTIDQTMREALSTSKIIKSKRQPPFFWENFNQSKICRASIKNFAYSFQVYLPQLCPL